MSPSLRALWLALIIFFSLAIGFGASALVRIDGKSLSTSVLTGGGAFGGTLALSLTVLAFATAGDG